MDFLPARISNDLLAELTQAVPAAGQILVRRNQTEKTVALRLRCVPAEEKIRRRSVEKASNAAIE